LKIEQIIFIARIHTNPFHKVGRFHAALFSTYITSSTISGNDYTMRTQLLSFMESINPILLQLTFMNHVRSSLKTTLDR
jgi:hypothetical protein